MLIDKLDCPIGLLIGYNCPSALFPRQVIAPQGQGPFAQLSHLGWGVIGSVQPSTSHSDCTGSSHHSIAY